MTCIAVVSDGTRCCMAADSQATSSGGAKSVLADSKMERVGPLLIAAEGSFSITQFARYRLGAPESVPNLGAWVAQKFVPDLRAYLKERDLMRSVNGMLEFPGNTLIARGPEWVLVDGGGSILRLAGDWWAIGSGAPEARGALWILQGREHMDASEMARWAVKAAVALDDGCCAPIAVAWTDA